MLKILFEDNDILVVEKPAGIESQSSRSFEPDMISLIKKHLSTNISTNSSTKRQEPYVGVIHRLDKPVSGVMVYAKNQKAAAALSKQVQEGTMQKIYYAATCGKPVDNVGNYVDYLLKDGKSNHSAIVDKGQAGCKKAALNFRVLAYKEVPDPVALVEVELLTGRHHQIRVQFSGHGYPLWGDNKYNPEWNGEAGSKKSGSLALSAIRLSLRHPADGRRMVFSMEPRHEIFEMFLEREKGEKYE